MKLPINEELIKTLFNGQKPYKHRIFQRSDHNYPHTHLTQEVLMEIFKIKMPTFILEVGSMVGGSAIRMAEVAKKIGKTPTIVCIDPFTGDVTMWAYETYLTETHQYRYINVKKGRATIRNRFDKNIIQAKLTNQILPLEMTSIVGLRLIKRLHHEGRLSRLPDWIYLDSAHELGETYLEAKLAFETLSIGGILFGDDWDWVAIEEDITRFAKDFSLKVNFLGNHWYIAKILETSSGDETVI